MENKDAIYVSSVIGCNNRKTLPFAFIFWSKEECFAVLFKSTTAYFSFYALSRAVLRNRGIQVFTDGKTHFFKIYLILQKSLYDQFLVDYYDNDLQYIVTS